MRVAMRPDAYPVDVDSGVYILAPGGPVRLNGPSVAQWLARLAPYLDGTATVADLTANLPAERADLVQRLIEDLQTGGVVRRLPEPPAAEVAEPNGYRPEVGFVDYFQDRAAERFQQWRDGGALLLGDGPWLAALAAAALRSGLRTVHVAWTGGGDEPDQLRHLGRRARQRDPEQRLVCTALADPIETGLPALLDQVAVVFHVIEETAATDPVVVERACAAAGVALAQVALCEGEAWLPPVRVGAAARWSAVRPRLIAARAGARHRAAPGGHIRRPGPATGPADMVLAARAVHRAFRVVTGVPADPEQQRPVRLDLDTLDSTPHPVLPHPWHGPASAPSAEECRARVAALSAAEPLTEAEFSRRAAVAVNERLGILAMSEGDWAQNPLYVSRAAVHDPAPPPGGPAPVAVIGDGFTFATARAQAALRGLAHYGARMVDPRRLRGMDGAALAAPDADPHELLAALRAGTRTGYAWGVELDGAGALRPVPAGLVFALAAQTPVGVAAGYDWSEALTTGMLHHCLRLTRREVAAAGAQRYPAVDLAASSLDETGQRCRAILTDLGELPTVYDLTGSLRVPTFGFCRGGRAVADAAGLTAATALRDGLRRVLRLVQAESHGQPEYAPPPPDLPAALEPCPGRPEPAPEGSALTVAELASRWRAMGQVPVAVPLDHDPELAAVMPYLVNVVICDD